MKSSDEFEVLNYRKVVSPSFGICVRSRYQNTFHFPLFPFSFFFSFQCLYPRFYCENFCIFNCIFFFREMQSFIILVYGIKQSRFIVFILLKQNLYYREMSFWNRSTDALGEQKGRLELLSLLLTVIASIARCELNSNMCVRR